MKNKGFTLVELMGVIILIGVISVIIVPVVKDVIKEAKQKGYENQVNTIVESAKNWAASNIDLLPETDSILVKIETLKKEGFLENKKLINPVSDEEMNACVMITYNEDYNQYEYEYNEKCFAPNPIIEYTDNCMEDSNAECSAGTLLNVPVNNQEKYNFYVLDDTGIELTLIMEQNLGSTVAWNVTNDNAQGPLTALAELEKLTSGWTNIQTKEYIYVDDGDMNRYNIAEPFIMRARMLTRTEVLKIQEENNNIMPTFLYQNLDSDDTTALPLGYWLSTADRNFTTCAVHMHYDGKLYGYTDRDYINVSGKHGLRPVIEISKSTVIY